MGHWRSRPPRPSTLGQPRARARAIPAKQRSGKAQRIRPRRRSLWAKIEVQIASTVRESCFISPVKEVLSLHSINDCSLICTSFPDLISETLREQAGRVHVFRGRLNTRYSSPSSCLVQHSPTPPAGWSSLPSLNICRLPPPPPPTPSGSYVCPLLSQPRQLFWFFILSLLNRRPVRVTNLSLHPSPLGQTGTTAIPASAAR